MCTCVTNLYIKKYHLSRRLLIGQKTENIFTSLKFREKFVNVHYLFAYLE